MTKKNLKVALGLVLMVASAAHAQTIRPAYSYPTYTSGNKVGAASIPIGDSAFFITPYVGLGVGHDSNVLLSETNELSSNLVIASPGLKVDARTAASVFQLAYQGQYARYTSSTNDNYYDHFFKGQYDMAFDGRSFLRLGLDYIHGHDPRGSTDRALSSHPDKYDLAIPNATFAYGAPGAQGRIELYASDAHKKYLNNRGTTESADRDTLEYGGAFYWRVGPKTYALLETRQTNIAYRQSFSPLSADESRAFVGVSWEATAATTGTIKVGRLRRAPDIGPARNFTSWEGLLTWSPRTYSTFDFYTARTTNEASGVGNYIISDIYGATWNHAWSSVLSTAVNARFQRDEYNGVSRSDDIKSLGLKVGYRFRRWLTLGAEYWYTNRDSNVQGIDYDKNLYMLTATASM